MIKRKRTKKLYVGDVAVGGDAQIPIQSMNNTDTRDIQATLAQLHRLAEVGCDISRLAVPDVAAAAALKTIVAHSPLPLVADIHYDYRLALASIDAGIHALRINPGNWSQKEGIIQVAKRAKDAGIPIRVGVNSGSLKRSVVDHFGGVTAEAMAFSAMESAALLEEHGFSDICISVKASDPTLMIEANRALSAQCDYPIHLGVTEAGTMFEGTIRSAIGIGTLLYEGIGDTIRVSLTADPVEEIRAGKAMLKALGLSSGGAVLVSCPTCGRTRVGLMELAARVETYLETVKKPITVAVMGCAVNGPGEARHADLGVAGGDGEFLLFRKGEIVEKIAEMDVMERLMREIEQFEP